MNEVKRYVNLAFVIAAMVMFWFFMKFSELVLSLVQVNDLRLMGEHVTISTVIGGVVAVIVAFLMWQPEDLRGFAQRRSRDEKSHLADETRDSLCHESRRSDEHHRGAHLIRIRLRRQRSHRAHLGHPIKREPSRYL